MAMSYPKGWHSRGYLPHFDSPETVQFITFRLADSLPRAVGEMLRPTEEAMTTLDGELDQGLGSCWLGQPDIAALVQDALLHFDGERYRLLGWRLMPNHVHVVAEAISDYSLSKIVQSWKSFTARQANAGLSRAALFGIPTISIASCATRRISIERSSTWNRTP
jgi:putative transposase